MRSFFLMRLFTNNSPVHHAVNNAVYYSHVNYSSMLVAQHGCRSMVYMTL